MNTALCNKEKYSDGTYEWDSGGTGSRDINHNGRYEIDCSHLVNVLLKDAGYNIPYQTTGQLHSSKYYEDVDAANVTRGDLILWKGHVGIVESFDAATGTGTFFGSQSSTGPATAKFGGKKDYWKEPDKFLRPKSEYTDKAADGRCGEKPRQFDPGLGTGPAIPRIKDKFNQGERTRSPIVLDLDGDGVETVGKASGTQFDHGADGFAETTGWVGFDDGLLVRDLDGNGRIDSGRELFGSETLLANGKKAAHGFEALKELDGNQDGRIDSADAAYSRLRTG